MKDEIDKLAAAYHDGTLTADEVASNLYAERPERLISSASPWIPVSERLPEPGRRCLISFAENPDHYCIARYDPAQPRWRWVDYSFGITLGEVGHWMPLPERPE